MEDKQQSYDEGKVYTSEELMVLAANKYKTMVEANEWMALSPEEEKILALEAKSQNIQKKQASTPSTPQSSSSSKSGKSTKKTKKGQKKKMRKEDLPAWKLRFPGQAFVDAMQFKMVNGRKYYWCPKHGYFTAHLPSACQLAPSTNPAAGGHNTQSTSTPSDTNQQQTAPSLRVSTAPMMDE